MTENIEDIFTERGEPEHNDYIPDVGYDINQKLSVAKTIRQKKAIIKKYSEDMTKALEKEFIYCDSAPYNPDDHWNRSMSISVITDLLANGLSLEQAYKFIEDKFGKSPEWVKTTKHKTVRRVFQEDVIETVEKTQKEHISKLERREQYDKISLIQSTTPNSQFNRIKRMLNTTERLEMLEKKVREIEMGNVVRDLFIEDRLSKIENNVKDILSVMTSDKSDIDKVNQLRDIGIKNKDIATIFGISERTLRRKLNGQ